MPKCRKCGKEFKPISYLNDDSAPFFTWSAPFLLVPFILMISRDWCPNCLNLLLRNCILPFKILFILGIIILLIIVGHLAFHSYLP